MGKPLKDGLFDIMDSNPVAWLDSAQQFRPASTVQDMHKQNQTTSIVCKTEADCSRNKLALSYFCEKGYSLTDIAVAFSVEVGH